LTDEIALVQTLDYFTPIVDDPYMFGQIAAANALSDVYAMGGKPITAMNIVGFPINKLDKQILANILKGAAAKVNEAGATLVGGHSIDDQEPKFGLSVTGIVHPEKIRTNIGAKPGDKLILTKPIGIGILTTAIKRDLLDEEHTRNIMHIMATLNKNAAEIMDDFTIHACTDITGFGLLGHTREMAVGSHVGVNIYFNQVPILPKTRELAVQGVIPGGSKKNHQWLKEHVIYSNDLDEIDQLILCDAITSGGLLVSVPEAEAEKLYNTLIENQISAAIIGEVTEEHPGKLKVL
jgi:selenide, water dikinase